MRAVIQRSLGGPEVLELADLPIPEPVPTEVQVRVRAGGINPVDLKTRGGKGASKVLGDPPFRIGWDVAGVVSAVGGGVTRFAVGDEVLGMPRFPREAGAYAEYVTAPSRQLVRKPVGLSDVEAGALPLAGLTAWQILEDAIGLREGESVLIHGAAGGVGHLAVQIARARGARVIATARSEQHEYLLGIGAERVLDYRGEDFERELGELSGLDAVIDFPGVYGPRSIDLLRPGGILVMIPSGAALDVIEQARAQGRRATGFMVEPDHVGLEGVTALIEQGRLEVRVDRAFELEEVVEAHRYVESGQAQGKVVLRVGE